MKFKIQFTKPSECVDFGSWLFWAWRLNKIRGRYWIGGEYREIGYRFFGVEFVWLAKDGIVDSEEEN